MLQLTKRMGIFMFHLYFFAFRCVGAEQYQYSLDIRDKLSSDWVLSDLGSVSRIECAHLCFKQESCSYFGYNVGMCHLLKNSVNEEDCAEDEESCSNPGMKIYKIREIKPPTTTEAITTTTAAKATTTTTKVTTTTEEPTTTATKEPTTTTTKEPTTTTEEPTTTTEEPTTTTTKEPTTTTEKLPTTTEELPTTVEELPTTVEELPTTVEELPTTVEELPTPEPEEPPTTTVVPTTTVSSTTTVTPTTTSTISPTTTIPQTTATAAPTTTGAPPTTTTDAPFSCEPPEGAQPELYCPAENFILNGLGSRSPFFGDALSPKCYDFKEIMYDEATDNVYTFFSLDLGFTINAQCPKEYDVITKFSLCVKKAHIPAITIHCSPIKDTDRIEKVFNATSEIWKDALVDCDDKAGLQAMFFSDSGDAIITRVIFQCFLFTVEDNAVEALAGDNKPATG